MTDSTACIFGAGGHCGFKLECYFRVVVINLTRKAMANIHLLEKAKFSIWTTKGQVENPGPPARCNNCHGFRISRIVDIHLHFVLSFVVMDIQSLSSLSHGHVSQWHFKGFRCSRIFRCSRGKNLRVTDIHLRLGESPKPKRCTFQ